VNRPRGGADGDFAALLSMMVPFSMIAPVSMIVPFNVSRSTTA
jgi:hypothetical protein